MSNIHFAVETEESLDKTDLPAFAKPLSGCEEGEDMAFMEVKDLSEKEAVNLSKFHFRSEHGVEAKVEEI